MGKNYTTSGDEGLGVRDLQAMNESLLMKFLWRIATGSEALWVKIVKAKYFPRSDLWHSKRDYKYTGFWKSMISLREILQPWVQWRIGGGDVCGAFAQPLFQMALNCKPNDESQRQLLVFQEVSDSLDDEQWLLYVNSAWALWRCRNDQVYGGKQPEFIQFRSYLYSINWESKLGATRNFGVMPGRGQQAATLTEIQTKFYCYSDGSWEEGWYGGVGVVMWHKAEMIFYKSKAVRGCCPLQVEAIALKESIASAITHGIVSCTFYSDCLILVQTCSSPQPPIDANWRAFDEILEVWKLLQENKSFLCVHVHRCQNDMADNLAKEGRLNGWDHLGHTFSCFNSKIRHSTDDVMG